MTGERTPRSDESNTSKGSTNRRSDSQKRSPRRKRSDSNRRKCRNSDNRAAYDTIAVVRRKVKAFKKQHLGARSKFDFESCSKCLTEEILDEWRMQEEDVKDYMEFLQLTLRKELDEEVMASDDYMDLISMSKRAQEFEILVPDVKRQLYSCLDKNVQKSCKSLKEMAENELIVAVSEYDEHLQQHQESVDAKKEEIEVSYAEYKKVLEPFSAFVKEGPDHTAKMNKVCNNLLEMCKTIEDWVKEDDEYPDKLLEEFNSFKKRKENLKVSCKENQDKKEENKKEIEKLKKSEARAGQHYSSHKQDKDKLKTRQDQLERKRNMLAEKREKKRAERDQLQEERENNPMSPRESDRFLERLEAIEETIAKIEREQKSTDKQLRRIERDMKPARDRTYEHKVDAVTHRHKREEIQKENRKLDEDIADIQEQMAKIDARMQLVMKIREMKLSPEAYRKSVKDKQKKDASQSDGSQQFSEACAYAAPAIGKNWPSVYISLPFDPPRELGRLERDVAIMDDIAARRDITDEEQALKSLKKWRSFNRHGNITELIETLRAVKLRQVASELEEMYGRGVV